MSDTAALIAGAPMAAVTLTHGQLNFCSAEMMAYLRKVETKAIDKCASFQSVLNSFRDICAKNTTNARNAPIRCATAVL